MTHRVSLLIIVNHYSQTVSGWTYRPKYGLNSYHSGKGQWYALVNSVIWTFGFHNRHGSSWTVEQPFISHGLQCGQLLSDLCVIEKYLQKKNS